VTRPTRQEQAQAILRRRARAMARRILGRHPVGAADFAAAFDLERMDLVAELPDEAALLALGRNVAGPADGLYVLRDEDGFRLYVQERGVPREVRRASTFEEARELAVDLLVLLEGVPLDLPPRWYGGTRGGATPRP